MQADMARHNPFNERVESYGTWHIRTPDGETPTSYDPKLHPHITGAPPALVCPAYEAAMVSAEDLCDFSSHVPVFIASTRSVLKNAWFCFFLFIMACESRYV